MVISDDIIVIANRLRNEIMQETTTVSQGQGVAMILLWSFFLDQARIQNVDKENLARDQLDAFIDYARENIKTKFVQPH